MIIACPACKTRFNVDGTKLAATGTRVRCAQCAHLWLQTPEGPLAPAEAKPAAPPPPPPPVVDEPPRAEAPRAQAKRLVEPKPVPIPMPPPRVPEPVAAEEETRGAPPPPAPTPPRGAPPGFKAGRKPEGDRFTGRDEGSAPASRTSVVRSEEAQPVRVKPSSSSVLPGTRVLPAEMEAPAKSRRRLRLIPFVILFVLLAAALGGAFLFRENIVRFWPRSAVLFEAIGAPVDVVGITFRNVVYTRPFADGVPAIEVHGELVNELKTAVVIPRLRAALLDGGGHELYHWTFTADAAKLEPRQVTSFASRLSSPPASARDLEIRFVRGNE